MRSGRPNALSHVFFVFGILVLSQFSGSAQTASPLRAFMDTLALQQRFNGLVLVVKNNTVLLERAYGKSDFRTGQDIRATTLFNLGSVSEEFTALAILRLYDEGKLDLDSPLVQHLPELSYNEITLRHLLSHTSGLPDYEQLFSIYSPATPLPSNTDLLTMLSKRAPSLRFRPGSRTQYSSTNFSLLALVVARVAGQPFEAYLSGSIFAPAGMAQARVWAPTGTEEQTDRALGFRSYILKAAELDPTEGQTQLVGGRNVLVSLNDLSKWHQAFTGTTWVKPATRALATAPVQLTTGEAATTGLGLPAANPGTQRLDQEGTQGSFRVLIRRDLATGTAVYLLTNTRTPGLYNLQDALWQAVTTGEMKTPPIAISAVVAEKLLIGDVASAVGAYKTAKRTNPKGYLFRESELNALGYELLDLNRIGDAIEIFKLNAQEYPRSFNVYDSLGEAYARKGEKNSAIIYYRKSLAIYPDNVNARQMLQKLVE